MAEPGSPVHREPGFAGLWQVSGRNIISYEDRVGFDQD